MALFRKTPNTISDAQWARIQRGARRTEAREPLGMFGPKAVRRRKAYDRQHDRRRWS